MPLTGEQTVKLSHIKDVQDRDIKRKERAYKRLKMLKDDFESEVKEHLKNYVSDETYKSMSKMINSTINVSKSVIYDLSVVYQTPPKRIFKSTTGKENEEQVEAITDIYRKAKINQKMKKANKYMNAVNDLFIQVVYRNDEIDVDIITPNVVSIDQDPDDLTSPQMVVIDKFPVDSISLLSEKRKQIVWTKDSHFGIDNNGEKIEINEGDINPYGVLPFVSVHREIPDGNFFDETSGSDLYKCTLIVGVLQTMIDYYFIWNSFKQLGLKTEDKLPEGISVKPDKAIHLTGENDEAFILDFQIKIKELLEALRNYIKSVIQNYGIDWDSMALNIKEVSGVALKIKNSKLQRLWNDQETVLLDVEQELFELIKLVYETHYDKSLDLTLSVNFAPFELYKDEKEDLEIAEKEMELNLKDLVEIFMQRNRSLNNYDEAKERLYKIIESNKEYRETTENPIESILK